MEILVDKKSVSKTVLLMSTLYDTDAREVYDDGTFIKFEYSDTNVPELIEEHAGDYPSFSDETLDTLVKNMEREVSNRVQSMIDKKAQEYGYTDMAYARSYVAFDNIFQERSIRLSKWGVSCWEKAGEVKGMVDAGVIPFPSVDIVMGYMPEYSDKEEVQT